MRLNIMAAVAALCVGGLVLAGCNQQQASNEAPAEPAAPAEQAPAAAGPADLSADANTKFLADNAMKEGVMVLPSGLQYRVVKPGMGKSPTVMDEVTVTYKGSLINGQVFDETQPGQTATFPTGQLIPGWVEALQLMKEGDEWEIVIPADLGYGSAGAGGVIPPDQTLVFQMALLKVGA